MQNQEISSKLVPANKIYQSYRLSKSIVTHTKLQRSTFLSNKYEANVYLKREDLQPVRSFKIRGAATAFRNLTNEEKERGVVTASAGNHAQGIAYCCKMFKIKGTIFMPSTTPKIKISNARRHGGEFLDIQLVGTTFDDAVTAGLKFSQDTNAVFLHAFNNIKVIEGQGGLAAEILEEWNHPNPINYVFTCVGGGGLASGIGCYFRQMAPDIDIIGFEPLGSPSMYNSLKAGKPIILDRIETFTDGASMAKTGNITFVLPP
jgi:threonine dehydratase